ETDALLQLAHLLLDRQPVPLDADPGLGDLGLAAAVRAEVPAEADEARADLLRLDDRRRRVVDRGPAAPPRGAAPPQRALRRLEALLLLEERHQRGIVLPGVVQRVVDGRHLGG